jgi:hypothetical protein
MDNILTILAAWFTAIPLQTRDPDQLYIGSINSGE